MRFYTLALAVAFCMAALVLNAPGSVAENVYSVSGIHVDASAASASSAELAAIAQGRAKAWAILYRRVTRQQDWPRQPQLDDAQLLRMTRGFDVRDERRSTTRYVASITYNFIPQAVTKILQSANVASVQAPAKRALVVPFAPNFAPGSEWAEALSDPHIVSSVVPFAVSGGSLFDQAKPVFETAKWADVSAAAARSHAAEVVLVQAKSGGGHMTLTLRRLGPTQLPVTSSVDVPLAKAGAKDTYPVAAQAAVHALEDLWKAHSAVDANQKGHLTAEVRIGSLDQWGSLQTALGAVPNVASVMVVAMNIGEARVSLTYIGSPDQLRDALSAQGVVLSNHGGDWTLSGGGRP